MGTDVHLLLTTNRNMQEQSHRVVRTKCCTEDEQKEDSLLGQARWTLPIKALSQSTGASKWEVVGRKGDGGGDQNGTNELPLGQ